MSDMFLIDLSLTKAESFHQLVMTDFHFVRLQKVQKKKEKIILILEAFSEIKKK